MEQALSCHERILVWGDPKVFKVNDKNILGGFMMSSKEVILQKIADAIIAGDENAATALAKEAVNVGVPPFDIIEKALQKALKVVGEKFEKKEYFFVDLQMSGLAAAEVVKTIKPYIKAGEAKYVGTYVIGTVEGDLHDIGKDLVAACLEAAGFKVIDLGVDVPTSKFVEAAVENKADIVGSSAAMAAASKEPQRWIEEALKKAGIRNKLKTMVGGIFVDQQWADEIGADAYGKDCFEAVKKAEELMQKLKEERGPDCMCRR
jgi:methylmalonyl-CoA mutase cobalamin-binding domain/chain